MKYKIMTIITILAAVAGMFAIQAYEPKNNRYHQHQEARQYTPCTDHGDDVFCTHLPLMDIHTDGEVPTPYVMTAEGHYKLDNRHKAIRNYDRVAATISYFDNPEANNHLTDLPVFTERALFRIRGASSRSFSKKGYAVKFVESDLTTEKKISLSGMTADANWVLHGPFLDKTMIRNYLLYNISGEIMDYAPNVRFCEVFLNDEYEGLYLIVEKIKYNSEGRVQMNKSDPQFAETSFLGRMDRGSRNPTTAMEPFSIYMDLDGNKGKNRCQFELLYPSATMTLDQKKYVERYISKMEKAIYSFDYSDPVKGFRKYVDEKSFIDYYIINEFSANDDAMALSTYFYKDYRGKLKLVVWDFNATFFYNLDKLYKFNSIWYRYMMKDEKFTENLIRRYRELRKSYLSDEYLINYIDQTVSYLGPAVDRNFQRWESYYTSEPSKLKTFNMEYKLRGKIEGPLWDHKGAVQQLKDAILFRGAYIDKHIEQFGILCHDSLNKKYNYREAGSF